MKLASWHLFPGGRSEKMSPVNGTPSTANNYVMTLSIVNVWSMEPAEKSDVKPFDPGQLWKLYFAYSTSDVPRKRTRMPENFFFFFLAYAVGKRFSLVLSGRHLCIWYLVGILFKSVLPVLEFLNMPRPWLCSHIVLIIHSRGRWRHTAAKENRCKYDNKTHLVVCNALILCL